MAEVNDEDYARFILACVEDCTCCRECRADIPCAGVMAGGLCDQACRCRRIEEDDERAWWCDDNWDEEDEGES